MAHAFYAYMGGFALDSSGTEKPILPAEKERLLLTLKGVAVALKLRPGLLQSQPFGKGHSLRPGFVVLSAMSGKADSISAYKSPRGRSILYDAI